MNKITKSKQNKIIILLVIILLCDFVMPNYNFADDNTGEGGVLFKYGIPLLLMIPDLLMEKLQHIFIDKKSSITLIDPFDGISGYAFLYSAGVIFSGTVPGLDVNFISPMGDKDTGIVKIEYKIYRYNEIKGDFDCDDLEEKYGLDLEEANSGTHYDDVASYLFWFGDDVCYITWKDKNNPEKEYWYHVSSTKNVPAIMYVVGGLMVVGGIVGAIFSGGSSLSISAAGLGVILGTGAIDFAVQNISEALTGGELYEVKEDPQYSDRKSIAFTLRKSIGTYYRALQEIALVILLCTLVYVSIRMVTCSTSSDKAKYKKMMWDWFAAVCLIFLLHFFMSMILTAVEAISDVFRKLVVKDGKDILMSDIRGKIGFVGTPQDPDKYFGKIFSSTIVYLALVIYTIQFTIIYLKRVIYMAFLTMIAPMVAFTYPLDKMKDGKAQALSLWMKEFIFNALMQPIHLILYCVFVQGAIGFVEQNPIYALVMIGFLMPAEKFVRQLFGLESSTSMGNMTAALGGAAVMNAMKKIKSSSGKGGGNNKNEKGGSKTKVRTANKDKDPLEALKKKDSVKAGQTEKSGKTGKTDKTGKSKTNKGNKQPSKIKMLANKIKTSKAITGAKNTLNKINNNKTIKGVKAVGKKYVLNKKTIRKITRGGARVTGAVALGTVGLAAGIATGDMNNAVAGLTGGIMAGDRLGQNVHDKVGNTVKGAKNVVGTFREGKYGTDEYEKMKFDKEFKKSEECKQLMSKYPDQADNIQEFLNAGITDPKQMEKAMKNIKEGKYSVDKATAYMHLANSESCPDDVLYDPKKFKEYLSQRKIPTDNADEIRKRIADFK